MQIKQLLLCTILACASVANAQIMIDLPAMEGPADDDCAPFGWEVNEPSPDIIEGNGPWPMGTYTVADVNGGSVSGKTMGMFLSDRNSIQEGWQTTLKNLRKGERYSFSFQWQQATLLSGETVAYRGGELLVSVAGDSTIFKSESDYKDGWQKVTVSFVAKETTALVVVKIHISSEASFSGEWGGAIVVDNVCKECHEAGMW